MKRGDNWEGGASRRRSRRTTRKRRKRRRRRCSSSFLLPSSHQCIALSALCRNPIGNARQAIEIQLTVYIALLHTDTYGNMCTRQYSWRLRVQHILQVRMQMPVGSWGGGGPADEEEGHYWVKWQNSLPLNKTLEYWTAFFSRFTSRGMWLALVAIMLSLKQELSSMPK